MIEHTQLASENMEIGALVRELHEKRRSGLGAFAKRAGIKVEHAFRMPLILPVAFLQKLAVNAALFPRQESIGNPTERADYAWFERDIAERPVENTLAAATGIGLAIAALQDERAQMLWLLYASALTLYVNLRRSEKR